MCATMQLATFVFFGIAGTPCAAALGEAQWAVHTRVIAADDSPTPPAAAQSVRRLVRRLGRHLIGRRTSSSHILVPVNTPGAVKAFMARGFKYTLLDRIQCDICWAAERLKNGKQALADAKKLVDAICPGYRAPASMLSKKQHDVDGCIKPSEYEFYRTADAIRPDTSDKCKGKAYQGQLQVFQTAKCPLFVQNCLLTALSKLNFDTHTIDAASLPMCWRTNLGRGSDAQDDVAQFVYGMVYQCSDHAATPKCHN